MQISGQDLQRHIREESISWYIAWQQPVLDFLSSWVSYATSLIFSHPLDTLRTRWQTLGQPPMTSIRGDGIRSLYVGFTTPLIANGPLVGVVFATNEAAKRVLASRHTGELSMEEIAMAGGFAGLSVSIVQCPFTVVRMHQQNSGSRGRVRLSARQVVRRFSEGEGIFRGLYRGWTLEAWTNCTGRMGYFAFYEAAKRTWLANEPSKELPLSVRICCAMLTSVFSWATIFPIDIVKNKIQADGFTLEAKAYRGFSHCVRSTYDSYGLRGFWRGYPITVLRSSIVSGISLPLYDHLRDLHRCVWGPRL